MKRSRFSSWRLGVLLCLPVLVLAGMSLWIWNAERRQAAGRRDAEARRWASWVQQNVLTTPAMEAALSALEVKVPRWMWEGTGQPPAAPAAAKWEEARSLLAAGQVQQAASLLGSLGPVAEEDITSAGLPLSVMLARTLLAVEPSPVRAEALAVAAVQFPGPLSGLLAADAAVHLAEARRELLLSRARRSAALYSWLQRQGSPGDAAQASVPGWRVNGVSATFVSLTSLEDLSAAVQQRLRGPSSPLPAWAGVAVSYHGQTLFGAPGEPIAASPERVPWAVEITMADAGAYQREFDRYSGFLTWILANVLLVTSVAMWLIYRTFRKQERLAQLQSEFVASVSHELRTPVASIGVLAERLESGIPDPARTAEYHHFIAREGRRLAALVDNVLDFSRMERGVMAYELEPADLPRIVRETAALIRPHAEDKQLTLIEVVDDVPEDLWPSVDAVAIRQALVNLLDNAVKFTPPGGTVTAEFTRAGDGAVCLRVRDTGIGIPAAEHRRIFDRFHRVDNGLRRETTGAGIGLSIVRHIALAHGAEVTVQSEPGRGSLFEIRFPASVKSTSHAAASS